MKEQNQLQKVAHFYIGRPVRFYNDVTDSWGKFRPMTASDLKLIHLGVPADLELKEPLEMPFDDYEVIDNLYGYEESTDGTGRYLSQSNHVRKIAITAYGVRALELAKQGYDMFGLLGTEFATLKTS